MSLITRSQVNKSNLLHEIRDIIIDFDNSKF